MKVYDQFYINGKWIKASQGAKMLDVVNPATEEVIAQVALGTEEDVNHALAAAKEAFKTYSATSVKYRLKLLNKIVAVFRERRKEIAMALTQEMGAPVTLSLGAQTEAFEIHTNVMLDVLKNYKFEKRQGNNLIVEEPIGVVGAITPWNWPINQIVCKILPVLASGCTMVLKPSEVAPINALLVAEILDEAGVPKGVFNLVNGDGPTAGEALSKHPDVDMISITGSTRAGAAVAKNAADTIKRIHQELGGKSANIILNDADFRDTITKGIQAVLLNSGQSCNAPTRMLVPKNRLEEVEEIIKDVINNTAVGDPASETTDIGPVVSEVQFDRIQALIKKGIDEGAKIVVGGLGRPDALKKGFYVKPTVFSNVNNSMTIAREEVFGPVLVILPYDNVEEAIAISNDTEYGLSNYVSSSNVDAALKIARQLRSGNVHINNADLDFAAHFGGYKKSGNGREWGAAGLKDFMESKAILIPAE